MEIIFLGTNGWYDTETGNTTCVIVKTLNYSIIFDAGSGIYKLDKYINFSQPVYIFLSHFHLDHIYGFHIINKFKFKELCICGPKDVKKTLENIICDPYTLPLKDLGFKIDFVNLPVEIEKLPFKVNCLPLAHSTYTLGYSVEIENKKVSFCTDTGYCDNAIKLSQNADIMITECSFKSDREDEEWPHLNPELAAKMAVKANPGQLYLIHFEASEYRCLEERKQAEEKARKIFSNTFSTYDDMVLDLQ